MRRFVLLTSLALLGAFVPAAQATLVFSRAQGGDNQIWAAADDGGGARMIASGGFTPRVAPDGAAVVYQTAYGPGTPQPKLMLVPAAGGNERTLLAPEWNADTLAWSPDSTRIAAVTGREVGTKRLVLVDVATGAVRTIATGQFYGVSFSPSGGAVVYARAARERYPSRASIWVAAVGGGKPMRLTSGHSDIYPLWGPHAVVFARQRRPTRRFDAWKQDLYTLSPAQGTVRRLTRQRPSFLLYGLSPVAWSADGTRLLAMFGGQDTAYAQTVDPRTGAVRTVDSQSDALVGSALSHDGSTILATRGNVEAGSHVDVVTVPYGGGTPTLLARDAYSPDWSR